MHPNDKAAIEKFREFYEKFKAFYMEYLLFWSIPICAGIGADNLAETYTSAYYGDKVIMDYDAFALGVTFLVLSWLCYRVWETKRKM